MFQSGPDEHLVDLEVGEQPVPAEAHSHLPGRVHRAQGLSAAFRGGHGHSLGEKLMAKPRLGAYDRMSQAEASAGRSPV